MTDEEYIRNRLDMINENSTYGLNAADQAYIANIIHSYIVRGIDCDYDIFNSPPPPIYIGPVKVKSLKERLEETKMNATSTETFHDIIAIDFELQTFPNPDVQDKFIVSATNRDDIFCFVFEGPDLRDACRNAGLFTGWEKDQKIRELEKKNDELTKAYDILDKTLDKTQKKCNEWYEKWVKWLRKYENIKEEYKEKLDVLQRKYDLERSANEAHHRFFIQYAGRGTEIEFNHTIRDDEVTYVIVDKDKYQNLKDGGNIAMIHDKVYNAVQLVDRVLELEEENNRLKDTAKEGDYVCLNSVPYDANDIKKLKEQIKRLEELKTPTIENFADDEPAADNVNHPSHYTGQYECIDVMQDVFGDEATDNFCLCNAFKYIWRANKKNGLEDVKKAVWYLNKYIEEAEKWGSKRGTNIDSKRDTN